jgi:hypothetical protein
MGYGRLIISLIVGALALALACSEGRAQSFNASLSGQVTDPTGAVVPEAELTLTAKDTAASASYTTGEDGWYTFSNLQPGRYELRVTKPGFRTYVQTGISLLTADLVRQDVTLALGSTSERLEVSASPSPLNFESAELKSGVNPETITKLPLLVSGAIRSSAQFMSILPGVTTTGTALEAHVNGAQQYAGEAIVDGASLVNPSGGNGMWSAITDFPQSPDMISEIKAISSNYPAQYGTTTGPIVIMNIRSGTNDFHGTLYEFHRNTVLNARQYGVDERSHDIENDFGGNFAGPVKVPFFWGPRNKTYFFVNLEAFRVAGSLTRNTHSIPSLQERLGDFTDWVDSEGNLIPIFDPDTTQPNPAFDPGQEVSESNPPFFRDQFMGCDGNTPNVICPSDPRLQNSLAKEWFSFLPQPTSSGALFNYLAPPTPGGFLNSDTTAFTIKIDEYWGERDHLSFSLYYRDIPPTLFSALPAPISSEGISYLKIWMFRANHDHTFGPSLLNHVTLGYNNASFYGGGIDGPYADDLPKIPGVASHRFPPAIYFDSGFDTLGSASGFAEEQPWPAPAYIANDMLTWAKGRHTLVFGGEYRNLQNTFHSFAGEPGLFEFTQPGTGLYWINSGSPIASFLLERVNWASSTFRSTNDVYGRADSFIGYFGDTFKVSPKFTLNFGLRWEMHRPYAEKWDRFSFFDAQTPNPGAGGRPGALVFAGTGSGQFGARRPEQTWTRGYGPRLGLAYAVRPKTVVRTGYGIFYDMANPPGWTSGIAQDGFNTSPVFASSLGGMEAAFVLSDGFPQGFPLPPFLDPGLLNGQPGPVYRPIEANRLPYSQQWNLTVEQQFTTNFYIGASYVGNKGTRLLSRVAALNALDPSYLSMGVQLYDEFQPGDTSLNGVPLPYDGWVEQMQACAPSVAQALLPYPQYCGGLFGANENAGNSTFHSFQLKVENRFSKGLWFLASYTLSKLLTSTDNNQPETASWSGLNGAISPYQRQRNKALALDDVPQTLVVSFTYELPFGKGKRWAAGSGVVPKLAGGWNVSSVFRVQSGTPFFIRSSQCTVPDQFRAACIPALRPGADPFAQSKSNFDPNAPFLNAASFESPDDFIFYMGQGPRVDNFRGFGRWNHDVAIERQIAVTERVGLHFRAEFFNAWNWHQFTSFDTDVASPTFGFWTFGVTNPRNIQLGARVTF